MAKVKIVIIGGGSYLWAPTIINEVIGKDNLRGSTITLMDIDPQALHRVSRLGKRILGQVGADFRIEETTNRQEALENADFVILAISTGGLEALSNDIRIPLKYGVNQSVGDTVGPGGISRTLRNVPVVVEIAEDIEEICPDAWLLNYTNPMAPVCKCVCLTTKIKVAGMCPGLYEQLHRLGRAFKLEDSSDIHALAGGINHLYWILEMQVKDKDGFGLLREMAEEHLSPLGPVTLEIFELFGYLPGPADRHIAEFFPFFLNTAHARRKYRIKLTGIEDRLARRSRLKTNIDEMVEGKKPISPRTSGIIEMSAEVISVLANHEEGTFVLNLPNKGQIANLPPGSIVETPSLVNSGRITGISIGDLPNEVLNIVLSHITEHELAVQAALQGNRRTALQALLMDPLVQDLDKARKMLNELCEANSEFLPRFSTRR